MNVFKTLLLSSLAKVFPDEYPPYAEIGSACLLRGERGACQIAFRSDDKLREIGVSVSSALSAEVFSVGLVPGEYVLSDVGDPDVLRTRPSIFPDILRPAETVDALPGQWHSIWIEFSSAAEGNYPLTVALREGDRLLAERTLDVTVLPADLPPQTLIHTNWFHSDCISTYYHLPVFSEEYWRVTENFARTAARHGVNMLLTPMFTPPLDTEPGRERPTVQLVDVELSDGKYSFGLEKLGRWFDMCLRSGIEYFEMSHLFTQWGAGHAPKVMAKTPEGFRRIFGWETEALSDEYKAFLRAFAAELVPFIEKRGLREKCYFHVSDEPGMHCFDAYSGASGLIKEIFPGFHIMDALSDYTFYKTGALNLPIPYIGSASEFIEHGVEGLWVYYCCGQSRGETNRFLAFPSARNRALGAQLYANGIKGFLQWGYNFWYGRNSLCEIDPFVTTDGGHAWPAGDPFVVYPGENGEPLVSLRFKVFSEGFQDMRALQLLESLIGREKTLAVLTQGLSEPLDFKHTPRGEDWLISMRGRINKTIAENL